MAIQPENKIFPHTAPAAPDSEDQLLDWARDTAFAIEELTRQIVDRFNLHVDHIQAHHKSWRYLRVRRPSFKRDPADNTKVLLEASASKPAYFVIGDKLYESLADLSMDVDVSGPGGLRTGLTKTADTLYYLYAVNNAGAVALLADTVAPPTGPTGYSDWTYIGVFVTVASGNLDAFQSKDGFYMQANSNSNHEVTSSDTSITSKTLTKVPATARFVYGRLIFSAINAAGDEIEMGSDSTATISRLQTATTTVGAAPIGFIWLPIITANTIYMRTTNASTTGIYRTLGWIEDPLEFK